MDTNTVLMPIIRPKSNDSWVVREWQTGNITPLVSEATESELLETLRKPRFRLKEDQILNIAAIYLNHCTKVEIPDPPPETPPCDDPHDQKFVILAYQAEADALVTKDGRLLALKRESEVPILSWHEFIVTIRDA